MIFSADDLRQPVIRDTLKYLHDWSPAAENLLLGTAIQESGLGFSLREGRCSGIYHISAATHKAIWDRYLIDEPEIASRVRGLAGQHSFFEDPHGELTTNMKYATAIAWYVYKRSGKELPDADDLEALATFWHRHFHSRATGSVKEFVRNYRELADQKREIAA